MNKKRVFSSSDMLEIIKIVIIAIIGIVIIKALLSAV